MTANSASVAVRIGDCDKQLERRRDVADQIAEAEHADHSHGDADRHAQHHQREQREKSGDGDGIGAHSKPCVSPFAASLSGENTSRTVRSTNSSTAEASPIQAMKK